MNLLRCTFLFFPITLLAQGGLPDRPHLYMKGEARIEKPADIVTLHLIESTPTGLSRGKPRFCQDIVSRLSPFGRMSTSSN
ncbi:MAG: hypothetical protein ABIR71_12720 [Chthoniobacterales bacterium]